MRQMSHPCEASGPFLHGPLVFFYAVGYDLDVSVGADAVQQD
jgi:hypothetical protein